jgi:Domain of unknown function (DUF4902)
MNLTEMGQVQTTVQELLTLRVKHLFSAADPDATGTPPTQRCGTATTLSGYTEWVGDTKLPISIGWDWSIIPHHTATHGTHWQRNDLPRTNIQLLNEHGQTLAWEDNLRVLATWVDARAWQMEVALAVGCNQPPLM